MHCILKNTSLRCTSFSNKMYGWNISQYVQSESFLLPLVRHHSHKNEHYSIQGCNTPSRKCTAYSWRIQPIFVQYSLQPIISFWKGQQLCRACNKSFKHVLAFFTFSQRYSTQFTAESRVVFEMHDLPDLLKKKTCSRYSTIFRKCISKVSVALSYAKCIVSLQVCYFFSTRQRF